MLLPPADLVAKAKARIHECSVLDVKDCLEPGTLLIDVRESGEFTKCHIPGAVHVPRGMLEFEIHALVEAHVAGTGMASQDQNIVLYCGTGGRSALAADALQQLGYKNIRSMSGGITAWNEAKLPVE